MSTDSCSQTVEKAEWLSGEALLALLGEDRILSDTAVGVEVLGDVVAAKISAADVAESLTGESVPSVPEIVPKLVPAMSRFPSIVGENGGWFVNFELADATGDPVTTALVLRFSVLDWKSLFSFMEK